MLVRGLWTVEGRLRGDELFFLHSSDVPLVASQSPEEPLRMFRRLRDDARDDIEPVDINQANADDGTNARHSP